MAVKINNVDSRVEISDGERSSTSSPVEIEKIVRIEMERFREGQALQSRIDAETEITNNVSSKEFFD